jgi:hypothetical protein
MAFHDDFFRIKLSIGKHHSKFRQTLLRSPEFAAAVRVRIFPPAPGVPRFTRAARPGERVPLTIDFFYPYFKINQFPF